MQAKDLIERLAREENLMLRREIFSPYFFTESSICTQIESIPYRFKIEPRNTIGFGIFKAKNSEFAKYVREASEEQVREYLNLLPKIKCILVFKTDFWHGISQNSTGYKNLNLGKVTPVFLVENAEPFDYFVGRFDGRSIWFESLDPNCDITKIEQVKERSKSGKKLDQIKGLTPEDEIAFNLVHKNKEEQITLTLEGRLKETFEKKGAKLDSYKERGSHIEIKWKSLKGHYYTSVVQKTGFGIVSAGICLSNQDHKFDLHSLIGIVDQGEKRNLIHITGNDVGPFDDIGADPDDDLDRDD